MVLLAMFSMVSAYHYSNKQKATTKAKSKAKVRKSHKVYHPFTYYYYSIYDHTPSSLTLIYIGVDIGCLISILVV